MNDRLYYISSWIDPGIYVPGHRENLKNKMGKGAGSGSRSRNKFRGVVASSVGPTSNCSGDEGDALDGGWDTSNGMHEFQNFDNISESQGLARSIGAGGHKIEFSRRGRQVEGIFPRQILGTLDG